MTEAPDDITAEVTADEERPGDHVPEGRDYVPEADAFEQWKPARPDEERPAGHPRAEGAMPPASEWDETEQSMDVPLDDDDYR